MSDVWIQPPELDKALTPCGYYPSGKNWHVRYSELDADGLMTGVIIQDGQEIAIRQTPSTSEELDALADAYMKGK